MNKLGNLRLCGMGWFKLHISNLVSNRDIILKWNGEALRRNSRPSKVYARMFSHTPLSLNEFLNYSEFLSDCDYLIIGNGYEGRMVVMEDLIDYFRKHGIRFSIKDTPDAVAEFFDLIRENERVCLLVHLTC